MSVATEFAFDAGAAVDDRAFHPGSPARLYPLRAVPALAPVRAVSPGPAVSPVPAPVPVPDGSDSRRVYGHRTESVPVLRPPLGADSAAPLRLTRRGVAVVAVAVAVAGMVLVWLAARSATGAAGSASARVYRGPSVVTVHPGDTLWSLASRVAPQADPRAEVAHLQQVNHLRGAALTPGQRLLVR